MKNTLVPIAIIPAFAVLAQVSDPPLKMSDVMYGSADFKRLEQLHELIKQGADVNAPIGFDRMLREGENPSLSSRKGTAWPLDVAVQQARVDMVELLLANGARLHGGELAQAAFAGNQDKSLAMIAALLQAGADTNSRHDSFTALFWASSRGNNNSVKLLMAQSGIKLDETNIDGETALMAAVKNGHAEIVEMLLKAGASVSITNRQGETATALAQKESEKRQAIVSKLQSYPK